MHPHQGPQLPYEIQQRDPCSPSRGGALVIKGPSYDDCDGGEEAHCCWEDPCVAPGGVRAEESCEGEEGVAACGEEGVEDYEGASRTVLVGEVGC